jgi:hypothetical protein
MSLLNPALDLIEPARQRFDAARAERDLSIPAWATQHLTIPRGDGLTRYSASFTPYWSRWHAIIRARVTSQIDADIPDAHRCEQVYLVAGSQIGKTFGLIVPTLAWLIAVHPRDCAYVLPSHDAIKQFTREKMRAVFRHSHRLADLLPQGQSERQRDLGIQAWLLDQMVIHWLNGAVALHLRSRDVPLMAFDEFDALPVDVDGQGSPLALGLERQKSFPANRLQLGITTPTITANLGWSTLCSGTHERLHLACPTCGGHAWLDPDRLRATDATLSPSQIQVADAARWSCPHCPALLCTDQVHAAVAAACAVNHFTAAGGWVPGSWSVDRTGRGSWMPDADQDGNRLIPRWPAISLKRTGWLNSLYARSVTLGEFLGRELTSRTARDADRQSHINNWRCEPWTPSVDSLSADLVNRLGSSNYQHGQAPRRAWKIVVTVDQQGWSWADSWFPYVARAWYEDGTSDLIEAGRVNNPAELDALTQRKWVTGDRADVATAVAIDQGNGNLVRDIRAWAAVDPNQRAALAGSASLAPDVAWHELRRTEKNAHKMCGCWQVWYYNSNLFRDLLFERVQAPGLWRVPGDAPPFYRDSLTSEERVLRDIASKGRRETRAVWQPRTHTDPQGVSHVRKDNHWWDCEAQQVALVTILGWLPIAGAQPAAPAETITGTIGV